MHVKGGGNLYVGTNDTSRGRLDLYGPSGDQAGGQLLIYNSADNDGTEEYYIMQTTADEAFNIGSASNVDMLKFLVGGTIKSTVALDVDAALTATTVDADTDFTVGGTVITDNTITDDGTLDIVATQVDHSTGLVTIGADDTTPGVLYLYGGADTENGGVLRWYLDAGDDATIEFYDARVNNDDLLIGSDGVSGMLKFIAETSCQFTVPLDVDAALTATTVDADTDFTVGTTVITSGDISSASLTLPDAGKVTWDPSPASDATMTGDMISQTVDANASGIGALLYKASDGNWEEADADSSATMGMLGIAVESGTGTKDVLIRGFVKDTAWSWTPGAQLFASTTTGAITATAPSATGDIVQVVGYATEATVMYFNPSVDFIEVA
jgi:hypothetical protein